MQCPSTLDTLRARLHRTEASPAPGAPTLREVFMTRAADAAGPGFVMSQLPRGPKPILWVMDRLSLREAGRPYLAGLADPPELLCLIVNRAVDVLWAMEQGLGCADLSAVVGEVWGDAPAVDFTATKRLAMRSETHAIPAWLMRRAASADLSAARDRWRLASAPSDLHPHDPRSPGAPRWKTELFRSRSQTPGTWVARYDANGSLLFETAAAPHRPASLAAQA